MNSGSIDPLRSPQRLYARVWRWHFFAALIVIPFVIWQSITGVLYLWHNEIAAVAYRDQVQVTPTAGRSSLEAQLATVLKHHPRERLQSMEVSEDPTRSTVFFFEDPNGLTFPAFTNPHTGEYLGHIESTSWIRGLSRGLHGGWPINPWGSYLLELGACWAIVMTLTGIYLWWPRNASGLAGVLYPRLRSGSRTFWRDLHATVGACFSLILLVFLFSALPWTSFWGENVLAPIEKATDQGSPLGFFFAAAHAGSHGEGDAHAGHASASPATPVLTLDRVIERARAAGARGLIELRPSPARDVMTLRDDHARSWDEVYLQLDGQTGAVRIKVGWAEQPMLAKIISLGIDLHEGHFFGRANQVFNTLVAVALLWLCVTGFMGWYKRRPEGGIGAPAKREIRFPKTIFAVAITLCIVMPLLGISIIVIEALDRILGRALARTA